MNTNTKEVELKELESVNGGGVLDFVDDCRAAWNCFWNGHGYVIKGEKHAPDGSYKVKMFICRCCGKVYYEKILSNGRWGECEQWEYDSL